MCLKRKLHFITGGGSRHLVHVGLKFKETIMQTILKIRQIVSILCKFAHVKKFKMVSLSCKLCILY